MTPAAAPSRCLACGPDAPRPRAALRLMNGRPLLQCPRCRLAWWDWPPFDPAALYDASYFQSPDSAAGYDDYAALEPGLRRTACGRLRRIARCQTPRPPAPRLLEIGCGPGVFLDAAAAAGWEVHGIEVSAYAAEQARRRGHPVQCAASEALDLPGEAYDAVAMWDVIEHLRDPARVLHAAARALRPGGVLALSTGDVTSLCARLCGARWHLFNLPEHLFFFSPAALRHLLAAAGLHVRLWTREVIWLPVTYLLERLRKSAAPKWWRPAARSPSGVLGALLLPATLLDVLGVYAVRGRGNRQPARDAVH